MPGLSFKTNKKGEQVPIDTPDDDTASAADTTIVGKFEWPKDIPGESKEAYQKRKDDALAEYNRKKAATPKPSPSPQKSAIRKVLAEK